MDGNEQSSGGKQSGIFSSPDLTVDTEKLAVHKDVVPVVKPSVPTQRPQNRKRTMIVIIAAALILVGVVVLAIVIGSQSSANPSTSNGDSTSLKESLNKYTNFLVSGKSDTTPLTNADLDPYNSKLYSVVYSSEANTVSSYFSEAQALLEAFLKQAQSAYTSNSSPENEIVLSLAESNKLQLGVIEEYATMEEFDITDSYTALGAVGFQQAVQQYYDSALQSSNEVLHEIAESKMEMADAISTVFGAYENYGCITNKALVESCAERILWTNEMLAAQDAFITAQNNSYQNANRLFMNLFSSCENLIDKVESTSNNLTEKE